MPDDVIIAFCDDNFGDVRRVPSLTGKRHPGGYGMYYHVSYYGAPRACKWLNCYQIEHMWEQLQLTYDYGVDKLWMLNVGSLKPHEYPVDFFMEMAWNPRRFRADNLHDYTRSFCASLFGEPFAEEAAVLLETYSQYAARITPELLDDKTFDLASGEYLSVRNEFLALEARALRLRNDLPAEAVDCYRQLILFPIQAMANLYDMYYGVAMNRRLFAEGELEANRWADHVEQCYRRDSLLCRDYNLGIADGKWNHMMDQVHIGYTSWHTPQHNVCPTVSRVTQPRAAGGYIHTMRHGTVTIEACRYHTAIAPQGTTWTVIPRYGSSIGGRASLPDKGGWASLPDKGGWTPTPDGSTSSGIALMPYTASTEGATLTYEIENDTPADSLTVTLILKSTMPFLGNGGHRLTIGFRGAAPQTVHINGLLNWENKYNLMYPTAAARVIRLPLRLPVPKGNHRWTLELTPQDSGIVLHRLHLLPH